MNAPLNLASHPLLAALDGFRSKIDFVLDFGDFEARTAQNAKEVEEILRLRHAIFFAEHGLADGAPDAIDTDRFDAMADHLVLRDKKADKIVGTYRMMCSLWTETYYSESEFDLSLVKQLPGIKLELGRACIHADYRNSAAIQMLWRGLVAYFTASGARYMFGCSSVDVRPGMDYGLLHAWLSAHHLSADNARVIPLASGYPDCVRLEGSAAVADAQWERRAERLTPALLKAYLRAGAKVCGMPAFDSEFNTLDYFTLFDLADLSDDYGKKFGVAAL